MTSLKTRAVNHKPYKIRLKVGDTVMVRAGKYKGQTGKILEVHPQANKVTVEGINIVKRHLKPTRTKPQGGIEEQTKPLWISKVGLYDQATKKATRVGFKLNKDGTKVRVYRPSGKEIK